MNRDILLLAFQNMITAKTLTDLYENNFKQVSKYVHATSRGHEAVQIAMGLQLSASDFVSPYYRDDAMLLALGCSPLNLMLQLFAKRDDVFSGGRLYYAHPSLNDADKPKIIHQSSATGMQSIPTTGIALGLKVKNKIDDNLSNHCISVCSLGDASVTEGEVAEAWQMAALHQLPIIYLVQDNGWDISATASETRAMTAFEYAKGFKGIKAISIDGSDFALAYAAIKDAIHDCRTNSQPYVIHASVPLLNHHTSGVRREWYRHDLEAHAARDPLPILKSTCLQFGISDSELFEIENNILEDVQMQFEKALQSDDPTPQDLYTHDFAPTALGYEIGSRCFGTEEKVMVDCALIALSQKMEEDPYVLLYGQDVGRRLGGVFREAATLAERFGDHRVFNTAIQEAFIIGSTVGMSAVGLKPVVEVQFADYIWPGLNQLFSEVSRSCYLTNGKYPVNMTLRVPIGAYGSGGPYHSSSVESVLTNIRGIKIVYPSNGADLFGFLKAAIEDPNPVVILEHKGLYWSKVKGTDAARCVLPSPDYRLPFGKALMVKEANFSVDNAKVLVITYGMGVHWALGAAPQFDGQIGILDLRSLFPLDEDMIYQEVKKYHRAILVTEEPVNNSFAQSVAARVQQHCFQYLDAPVMTVGSENLPAVPLNEVLEKTMIYSSHKLINDLNYILSY